MSSVEAIELLGGAARIRTRVRGFAPWRRGGSTGWRPGPLYGGKGYSNPVGPTNMALSGPGAGREVMRSGGQGQHGAANPGNAPAKSTDILRQFGPDSRK